jgi:hypothetical protein
MASRSFYAVVPYPSLCAVAVYRFLSLASRDAFYFRALSTGTNCWRVSASSPNVRRALYSRGFLNADNWPVDGVMVYELVEDLKITG